MPANQLPIELRNALKAGDIAECKRLFSECEPNATVYKNHSLNVFSLVPMPREFALWAQEQGADINFRDTCGQTPIFEIARRDADLPLLIELGAEVNTARQDGWTPLHVAAARGNKKAVRTLLKAGADIHAKTAGRDSFGFFTPVELVLCQQDLSCSKKYELCKLLLDKGAEATGRCRLFASAFSEVFHRHNAGKKPSKFLENQAAALEKLCGLFGAELLPAAAFHDGVSPVLITAVGGFKDNLDELWDFLVPPQGRAATAQGEVIRIAGRVRDELLRNGGMNWDEDYRAMLRTFREYMLLGNGSDGKEEYACSIIDALMDGDVNDAMIYRLGYCAKAWVESNPEAWPALDAEYTR